MNLLFIGGDMRYIKIIQDLKDKNNIKTIGYDDIIFANVEKFDINKDDISNIDIIVLPINGIKEDYSVDSMFSKNKVNIPKDLFYKCKDKTQIFTGKINSTLESMINDNIVVNNLLDDYDVKRGNSLITVEGIIENLMNNRDGKTIYNSNIVVLGYGNIGKPLVYVLNHLGANLKVGVKEYEDYIALFKSRIGAFDTSITSDMEDNIINADIIINTVPKHVIPTTIIDRINDNCYILDISSPPYGFDKNDVKKKNYFIYSKIPSKYSPVSSGMLLEKKIKSISGGIL